MRYPAHLLRFACAAAVLSLFVASGANAQQASDPRPEDIDPAVDTSAPPDAFDTREARELEPAVDTSAPVSSVDRPDVTDVSSDDGISDSVAARESASRSANGESVAAAADAGARRAAGGRAQDRIELDTTQITGNRELPKVLYIVPWKRADLGDLVGKPVNSLLDEVLTPVDRDVFRRENRYYRALMPEEAGEAAPSAGAAATGGAGRSGSGASAAPGTRDER